MQVKKSNLELIFNVLKETKLNLADARLRDAFLKDALDKIKLFNEDRKKVLETFCDKKEDGTPDVKDDKYSFQPAVVEDLTKELDTLANETVEVVGNDSIKTFIEKTEYSPKPGEAELIDNILK